MQKLKKEMMVIITLVMVLLTGCGSSALPKVPFYATMHLGHAGKLEMLYYDTNTYGYKGENRDMQKYAIVYVPYGYDESKQYDVLFLMHGMGGSAARFLGTPDEPREDKYMIDYLIRTGKMEPMIIVDISYYPDNQADDNDDFDAALTKNFGTELRNDLLPAVEAKYSVYRDRDHRAFGGFSMGAVTTWYRMCDSMDLFSKYIAMSGSLYWGAQDQERNDPSGYITSTIQSEGYGKGDFKVWAATGSNDFANDTMVRQMDALKQTHLFDFSEDGNTTWNIGDGEKHNSHATTRYLYTALRAMFPAE
ncbi:MAG: alpha/beta hydrolase-fold protein [Lactimicrobium sp.]|jgi:predicted esterase|uniref:alpha/beta hydrolase n=1 Tax=Lactimicrobium sp. TaxID=2563780 RepID=UPI002F358A5F